METGPHTGPHFCPFDVQAYSPIIQKKCRANYPSLAELWNSLISKSPAMIPLRPAVFFKRRRNKIPNSGHRHLLGKRRNRPRGRRPAKQRDKLAASYESRHLIPPAGRLRPNDSTVERCSARPAAALTVCLAYLGGALCPAPIRWLDPCGPGRFVVRYFNVADQVADVFYTIEIRIRDFHGGEGLLHSAYLFKRQQVGECHDAPPIGPNALLRNQAIRSRVWRCFKIVRVLQERHCYPRKPDKKPCVTISTHGLITMELKVSPANGGMRLMQHRAEEAGIVQCPGCHRPMDAQERTLVTVRLVDIRYVCATCGMETKRTVTEEMQKRG